MALIEGGYTNYGQVLGIIMLDTRFPRLPGDVGNAATFPFPVRYQVVKGASPLKVVEEADPALLTPFIAAAQELEAAGVRTITTSCGFLALWQAELAASVKVPLFTSSLLQVPLAWRLTGGRPVGIITAHAPSLSPRHLAAVGAEDVPHVIYGLEEAPEFTRTFIRGEATLDPAAVENEVRHAARRLASAHPEIGSIVLECTNLPPFARAVQEESRLPVFDIVSLCHLVARAGACSTYPPFAGWAPVSG
ncbi:MAG TPA: aspartate/glutamate racemase family protein [Firmicutes bacterium]|nr:aspartate/glutamate racemase family protein [Bacillota bacterium]